MSQTMKFFWFAIFSTIALALISCSDEAAFKTNPFDSGNTNTSTNANFQLYPVPTLIKGADQKLRSVPNIQGVTIPVGGSGQSGAVAGIRLKSGSSPLWMIYFAASGSNPKLTRFTYTGSNTVGNTASVNINPVKNNFLYTLGDDIYAQTNEGIIQRYATNSMTPGATYSLNTPSGLGGGTLFSINDLKMDGFGAYYALAFSPRAYLIKYPPGGGNYLWYTYVGNANAVSFHRQSGYITVLLDYDSQYPKVNIYDGDTGNFIKTYKNVNKVFSASQAQIQNFTPNFMRRIGDYLYFGTSSIGFSSGSGTAPFLYFFRWYEGPYSEPVRLWPNPESIISVGTTDDEDLIVLTDFDSSSKIAVYTKK